MKIKTIALLLAALMLLPAFAACHKQESADTSTTTASTTAPPEQERPIRDTPYDEAGLEMMRTVINDYYDMRDHSLSSQPNSSGDSSVWGVASYVEALAETYRLYPDDQTIKAAYIAAIDQCLARYEVKDAVIQTPSGSQTVTYYNAGVGGRGDYYFDDDAWLCIQFLNAYELLGDASYLAQAEETLEFLWAGWDDLLGGGIYWDKDYDGKNTCANGPIAIAFLWAYQLTEKADYLEKGKMIYDWCREVLLEEDLYCDSISVEGEINHWKAAYNQGVMLYSGAQLYEITGDEKYYEETKALFIATTVLMFKGYGNAVEMNGNPIFNAWCIGWLVRGYIKYYTVDPDKNDLPMKNIDRILQKVLGTKNAEGYYDPYFLSGEYADQSITDILQPCGMTSVFCLTHYFTTQILE